jgi:hypothetical protein
VAILVVLGGCTSTGVRGLFPSASRTPETLAPPVADPLCPVGPSTSPTPTESEPGGVEEVGTLSQGIAEVADQVEEIRGLTFERPVVPELKSRAELEALLRKQLQVAIPEDEAARQQRTYITIGALPSGTDLHEAFVAYASTQIVGFYDTVAKRLVFQGDAELRPFPRWVLAHELTHALDDQHFDLSRLDTLNRTCSDDRATAYLALAEGDAVESQLAWTARFLSGAEVQQLQNEAASLPPSPETPPFIENLFFFPYPNGQVFVRALQDRGGQEAVDAAFLDPPVSTEQILHPDAYPSDLPQVVTIEDLSSKLGPGWELADQQEAGEGFLRVLFELRLSGQEAEEGANGWDGGLMRTWANDDRSVVLMRTVWDTERDASGFASMMERWLEAEDGEVRRDGEMVEVLFGSDAAALEALQEAMGR